MKAAIIERYGPAYSFKIREMPEPEINDSEMLVKVKASSVNPVDWKIRKGKLKVVTGTNFPKILGADFSGEVMKTGRQVRNYQKGDHVYGLVNAALGGAYAQYLKVKPQNLAPQPDKLNAEEAASIPLAGITALQGLRDHAQLTAEQKIIINGASGGVGTFAVQIARSMGARVSGVCSTDNLETVKSLGAEHVIDYTKEEVFMPGRKYHVIFDTIGNLSFQQASKCLYDDGIMVTTLNKPGNLLQVLLSKFNKHKSMKTFLMVPSSEDLEELKQLVERRQLRPVLDTVYPLENIAEAHEYSQTGHARGKIAISMKD